MNSSDPIRLDYHSERRVRVSPRASLVMLGLAYLLPTLIWIAAYSVLRTVFWTKTGRWKPELIYVLSDPWPERFRFWIESAVPSAVFTIPYWRHSSRSFLSTDWTCPV